jgi:hypothetical protein
MGMCRIATFRHKSNRRISNFATINLCAETQLVLPHVIPSRCGERRASLCAVKRGEWDMAR